MLKKADLLAKPVRSKVELSDQVYLPLQFLQSQLQDCSLCLA